MKIQAIIPAAGLGTRLKSDIDKPLISLNGHPVFLYPLRLFQRCHLIESVIVVVNGKNLLSFKTIIKKHKLTKVAKIIVGGETRCDSVYNGLKELDADTDLVMIHDAVRPFVTRSLLEDIISVGKKKEAVVVGVPVKSTIKRVELKEMLVEKTLDREILWEIQTPQIFKKEILLNAYDQGRVGIPTDDATLVEQSGIKVHVVVGDYQNIKITTQEDLIFAQAILDLRQAEDN